VGCFSRVSFALGPFQASSSNRDGGIGGLKNARSITRLEKGVRARACARGSHRQARRSGPLPCDPEHQKPRGLIKVRDRSHLLSVAQASSPSMLYRKNAATSSVGSNAVLGRARHGFRPESYYTSDYFSGSVPDGYADYIRHGKHPSP